MTSPQQRMNTALIEWDRSAEAFAEAANAEAAAQVDWEKFAARRRILLRSKAAEAGEKLTVPDLDAQILVDDDAGLYDAYVIAKALVTGLRKRLDVYEKQFEGARSEMSSERARQSAWEASPSVPQWSHGGQEWT